MINVTPSATQAQISRPLFDRFALGPLLLANRFVMAPMTRNFAPAGVPGADVAAYYRRRAEGGVGLIITEGTWVPHPGASNEDRVPDFHGEAALAGWRRVVDAVHAAGGRIVPQLWHSGLIDKQPTLEHPQGQPARSAQIGPSGISGGVGTALRPVRPAMTLADIDAVVEAFATAAQAAREIGFDGVALHGAHGYIIDQFLWHATNFRTDRYGGSHADRATFAAEIVAEIRHRTGPDFPILFRTSQWKSQDYKARLAETPDDWAALMRPIAEAGVDLFDCSQRRYWEPAFVGSDGNLAALTKEVTGKPTITVGAVGIATDFLSSLFVRGTPATATGINRLIALFERGDFDLVGVGRALLADPEWVRKLQEGRIDEARPFSARLLKTLD